jgi:hypothetical protein
VNAESSQQRASATPDSRWSRWWWLAIAALGAAALFFPFEREVTPAWAFDVVDANRHPMPGCRVEQHWEWRAAGVDRIDTAVSDAGGRVSFPRRSARVSVARQWYGAMSGFGFHSAFPGPRSYFFGCAPGRYPDRLDAEKVGDQIVFSYVPGAQVSGKPIPTH